jgi:hypothetical protein
MGTLIVFHGVSVAVSNPMSALDWPKTKLFPQLARSVAAIPVPGENPDHRLDADVVIASHDLSVG